MQNTIVYTCPWSSLIRTIISSVWWFVAAFSIVGETLIWGWQLINRVTICVSFSAFRLHLFADVGDYPGADEVGDVSAQGPRSATGNAWIRWLLGLCVYLGWVVLHWRLKLAFGPLWQNLWGLYSGTPLNRTPTGPVFLSTIATCPHFRVAYCGFKGRQIMFV